MIYIYHAITRSEKSYLNKRGSEEKRCNYIIDLEYMRTGSRFWTALPFSMDTISASMSAIKNPQLGVKHAFTTIWGDEGNECDMCVLLTSPFFCLHPPYLKKRMYIC
jgi:hypothetical protein